MDFAYENMYKYQCYLLYIICQYNNILYIMVRKKTILMSEEKSIFDIVLNKLSTLTPNEKKIAQVLIDDYPSNGLRSIPQFSKAAGTSHPTVLRFIQKIGFNGYPEFQEALRTEVRTKFKTLPERYQDFTIDSLKNTEYEQYSKNFTAILDRSLTDNNRLNIKKIAKLLAGNTKRVFIISGIMSKHIGVMCTSYINFIRPNVTHIYLQDNQAIATMDVNKGDVIIAIDMPRYEKGITQFSLAAKERGASIILMTDDSLSSDVVKCANHILTNRILSPAPFDTYMGCVVQIELVAVELIVQQKEKFATRMNRMEKIMQNLD